MTNENNELAFRGRCHNCGANRNKMFDLVESNQPDKLLPILAKCHDCRIALAAVMREKTGYCFCGQRMDLHTRCTYCGVYLGNFHETQPIETDDGEIWCGRCRPQRINGLPTNEKKFAEMVKKKTKKKHEK